MLFLAKNLKGGDFIIENSNLYILCLFEFLHPFSSKYFLSQSIPRVHRIPMSNPLV